jgi:poly(A) polymerase
VREVLRLKPAVSEKTATMATPGSQHLGVTAPLSTALPTESENQASNALIEELKRQNNYESAADTQKR